MSGDLAPRPPEGDWLGTPYLRFERAGSVATVVVDRPEARNALRAAMYFGLRYAIDRVNGDDGLAGLLVTGTGDVFIPGGDLGGTNATGGPTCPGCSAWTTPRSTPCAAHPSPW
jgi:enoyl-CoA hydratase